MKQPTEKFKQIRHNKIWAGILLVQFLLFYIFSKVDFFVHLFERFFEFQKTVHQKVFSFFAFSIGDVLYILLGIFLLLVFFKILKRKNRKRYVGVLLVACNILYFLYQIFWGMVYFQSPLLKKLPKEEITVQETKALTLKYLMLCKATRQLTPEDSRGVFVINDLEKIKKEILRRQNNFPTVLEIEKKQTDILSMKPSLYKGMMSYSGILGYYNPFTAEAQYNPNLPHSYLAFTLSHESAHQLGFAREQEANFIGYLIGRNSEDVSLKYSTQYFVLKSLLRSLSKKNPEFVKSVISNYSEGMKRDRAAEQSFNKEHEGLLTVIFGITNDLFLKSNRQEGSITYSYFVELLVRYERITPN